MTEMIMTAEEKAIVEAYLRGEDIEALEQDLEDDIPTKSMSRASRRKKAISKNKRKKRIFADMSDAHQQYAAIDFWDEENGSHGRNSDYKAFFKRLAKKAARRKVVGSGRAGYKKTFDLKRDIV